MQDNMKDFGSMISEMVNDSSDILMATLTLDSLSMEKHMVKVSILGRMARSMMVNGIKELSKAMVFGKESGMILT